jgi:hypothetical protein
MIQLQVVYGIYMVDKNGAEDRARGCTSILELMNALVEEQDRPSAQDKRAVVYKEYWAESKLDRKERWAL